MTYLHEKASSFYAVGPSSVALLLSIAVVGFIYLGIATGRAADNGRVEVAVASMDLSQATAAVLLDSRPH
jgi:hypothetical protein